MENRVLYCRTSKVLANKLIEEQASSVRQVTVLPPETVDEQTDEDEFQEEDDIVGAPTAAGDIAGAFEIECYDDEESPIVESQTGNKSRFRNISEPNWKRRNFDDDFSKMTFDKELIDSKVSNLCETDDSVSLFEHFFDESIISMIVEQSKLYATQKNCHNFELDCDDLKAFIGFLIFSGYHTLPR